jgi:hypothetical protein
MSEQPTLLHLSEPLRIAVWRDIFFELWTGPGKVDDVKLLHRTHADYLKKYAGQVAAVSVIRAPSLKGIDDDIREEVKRRLGTIRARTSASLTVIESRGFTASEIRSLIGGLILFTRSPYPNKVFDTIDAGAGWLCGYLAPVAGRPVQAAQVKAVYDFLLAAG